MDAEVVEGAEQTEVESCPEAQFRRYPAIEPGQNRLPIRTLRRGGQPQQQLGAQMLQLLAAAW